MTLADAEQRQQALDTGGSYIVQAPAGSGKTGILTLRILKLLALVNKPEQVLAITFTKKAAAEMRMRVMEALQLGQNLTEPADAYDRLFYQLAKVVLQRNSERNWGLLENPNRLQLLTIDGFCNSIVRGRPISSGLGARPSISTDPAELYKSAVRELLLSLDQDDEVGTPLKRVLNGFNNQYAKLNDLLCQMLSQRDHWLSDITHIHSDMEGLKTLLEQSLEGLSEAALEDLKAYLAPDFFIELASLCQYAENQLSTLEPNHFLLQPTVSQTDKLKQQLRLFLTKTDLSVLKTISKRQGFPAGESKEEKAQAKAYKDRAKLLLERLQAGGAPGLQAIRAFVTIPECSIDPYHWSLLQDLVVVVRYAAAHLKLEFQRRNSVDFTEVALSALDSLGSGNNPGEALLQLDDQIQHILVDEFQDTSIIQVDLLERLTEGWQPDDGRTLFLVGDPMQSIYGFRKADVGLFLQLWQQRRLGGVNIVPLQLSTNFRSSKTIIDWVNDFFSLSFPARADQRQGAVPFAESIFNKQPLADDRVEIALFEGDDKERQALNRQEANWIASKINDLEPTNSVAILVKGKNHILDLIPALKQHDIPYQAVELETLSDNQVITDMLSLVSAFISPSDKAAWFAILRGPWCGLTLKQLHFLSEQGDSPWLAICSLIENSTADLDEHMLTKLQLLHNAFREAYRSRGSLDFVTCIQQLLLRLGMPASFEMNKVEVSELFLSSLRDVAFIGDTPDMEEFKRKLGDLFVPTSPVTDASKPTVNIMTMHKSKGLEYDVVFLPQLHRQKRSDDRPLILIEKQSSLTSYQQELFIAPIDNDAHVNGLYRYLRQLDSQRKLNEVTRLLYVACTRAKRQLYLTGLVSLDSDNQRKTPSNGTLLALLWPHLERMELVDYHSYIESEFETVEYVFRRPESELTQKLLLALPSNPESPAGPLSESNPANTVIDETEEGRRKAGVILHRALELASKRADGIENLRQHNDSNFWLRQLMQAGVSDVMAHQEAALLVKAVEMFSASKTIDWILDCNHKKSRQELPISYVDDEGSVKLAVIDRCFEENGVRHIIDYKFSQPSGDLDAFLDKERLHYYDQLHLYSNLMNAVEPMATKTYLYFPLIDHLYEVDTLCQ